jgi:DNA-binding LacI/PurR family transcriptional regulator
MTQPTMQQVAEAAGVSTALVSLVIRGAPNVSDKRRALVLKAADELGYRPNVLARNLASRRTHTLGVVVNDLHNPFFAEMVDGIQTTAAANGYRILIGNGQHSRRGEADAIETLLQLRVDGLVLAGAVVTEGEMERAAKSTAVVAIGRTTSSLQIDTVNCDESVGARLVIDHLVSLGHRRISHIDGGSGAGAARRREGYEAWMCEYGLADCISTAQGDFSESGGYNAADELLTLDPRPTAIFAANDLSAAGALDRVEDAGLDVPSDLAIVGYDNTGLAAMHHLSLTTINQPRGEFGRIATELILQRLDDGRSSAVHHVVAPTLVVRRTSGTHVEPFREAEVAP